ncbi:MAG: histidine triad nucleotide-binding protein [Peptococcaceae bacterium]|nr:histidine triad nucleotide-binding protein [Peptococcaceae bacterium]
MENCIFCRIVRKELPAKILYENDLVLAFADLFPVAPVHVLIVPKEHIPRIDSPEAALCLPPVFAALNYLVGMLNLEAKGFRVVTNAGLDGGQTVPHLHWHLLGGRPLNWPPG